MFDETDASKAKPEEMLSEDQRNRQEYKAGTNADLDDPAILADRSDKILHKILEFVEDKRRAAKIDKEDNNSISELLQRWEDRDDITVEEQKSLVIDMENAYFEMNPPREYILTGQAVDGQAAKNEIMTSSLLVEQIGDKLDILTDEQILNLYRTVSGIEQHDFININSAYQSTAANPDLSQCVDNLMKSEIRTMLFDRNGKELLALVENLGNKDTLENNSTLESIKKIADLTQTGFKDFAVRFVNIKEYQEIMSSGDLGKREVSVRKPVSFTNKGWIAQGDDKESDFNRYLTHLTWSPDDIAARETDWHWSTEGIELYDKYLTPLIDESKIRAEKAHTTDPSIDRHKEFAKQLADLLKRDFQGTFSKPSKYFSTDRLPHKNDLTNYEVSSVSSMSFGGLYDFLRLARNPKKRMKKRSITMAVKMLKKYMTFWKTRKHMPTCQN